MELHVYGTSRAIPVQNLKDPLKIITITAENRTSIKFGHHAITVYIDTVYVKF